MPGAQENLTTNMLRTPLEKGLGFVMGTRHPVVLFLFDAAATAAAQICFGKAYFAFLVNC